MNDVLCNGCGQSYPLTSEYWHKNSTSGRNGFAYHCKRCAIDRASRHYQDNKAHKIAYAHKHYDTYKERHKLVSKQWAAKNADKVAGIKHAYIERNPEKRRQSANAYGHSEKGRLSRLRRRARREELPDTFTENEWYAALEYWGRSCAACGEFTNIHADHWIPLSSDRCTGTIATNIVPLCQHCNSSKKNRVAELWVIKKHGADNGPHILARIEAYFAWLISHS